MNRQSIKVALSVFVFSIVSEFLCIRILRGSLTDLLDHPHRRLLLLAMILVNLLNAATALYFSSRAVRAEVRLKLKERKEAEINAYLNHHRNALTVVQNAAFLSNDEQTMKMCDDAVARIVQVLVSTEASVTDPSAVLFAASLPNRNPGMRKGTA